MDNSRINSRLFRQCDALSLNPSKASTIATIAISTAACPLTILLNALILTAVGLKKELRTIPTILLTSLAATDLLVGVLADPLFISAGILYLQNDYETTCILIITGLFTMHLICTSIYHLTAMAWERYQAITNAIKYQVIVTRGRVKMCAIASWVLTVLSILPSALYLPGFIDQSQSNILKACFFSVPMTICLVAIAVFYIMIYRETRRRQQGIVPQLLSQSTANAAAERKVAKTTFFLTVALFLSFAPTAVILLLAHLFETSAEDVFQWLVTFNQLNSLSNPILYFYRNPRLRNTVLEMLHMRKPSTNPIPGGGARVPQGSNNAKKQGRHEINPISNSFVEKQETSSAPREKTAPQINLASETMAPTEESNSLNQTSGSSGVSGAEDLRIRTATMEAGRTQEDPLIFAKKERQPHQTHVYAKKARPFSGREVLKSSLKNQISPSELSQDPNGIQSPYSVNRIQTKPNACKTNLIEEEERQPHQTHGYAKKARLVPVPEVLKSRKLSEYRISPGELSQDPNNGIQSFYSVNRTQTKPKVWVEKNIEEEKQDDLHEMRSMTAPVPSDNSDVSKREVNLPIRSKRFLKLRATSIGVQDTSLQN